MYAIYEKNEQIIFTQFSNSIEIKIMTTYLTVLVEWASRFFNLEFGCNYPVLSSFSLYLIFENTPAPRPNPTRRAIVTCTCDVCGACRDVRVGRPEATRCHPRTRCVRWRAPVSGIAAVGTATGCWPETAEDRHRLAGTPCPAGYRACSTGRWTL